MPLPILALALTVLPQIQAAERPAALRGLDPVELCQGREVPGLPDHTLTRYRFRYVFSSPESQARFEADPLRWEIQLGGGCGRMGPLSGAGDPDRFAVHYGRLYVFASDGCRAGFLKDPEAHFDPDQAALESDTESRARGRRVLEAVLAAHGGAERIDAVETYDARRSRTTTYEGREVESSWRWVGAFPDRSAYFVTWDDSLWGDVVAAEEAFQVSPREDGGGWASETMHPALRRAATRRVSRELLWLFKARQRPDFEVVHIGSAGDLELLALHVDGMNTFLSVDRDSSRVRTLSYFGRPGSGQMHDVTLTFSDEREVGGLRLPFRVDTKLDGKPSESLSFTYDSITIDGELEPDLFRRP